MRSFVVKKMGAAEARPGFFSLQELYAYSFTMWRRPHKNLPALAKVAIC